MTPFRTRVWLDTPDGVLNEVTAEFFIDFDEDGPCDARFLLLPVLEIGRDHIRRICGQREIDRIEAEALAAFEVPEREPSEWIERMQLEDTAAE